MLKLESHTPSSAMAGVMRSIEMVSAEEMREEEDDGLTEKLQGQRQSQRRHSRAAQ